MVSWAQLIASTGVKPQLVGHVLTTSTMPEGKEVSWVPSYGPEMRGGTAYCTVVVSDRPIGSPVIKNPTHLVAMNRPSLEKFADSVRPGGIIFINGSLISIRSGRDDVQELIVPAIEIAKDLGTVKAANVVALSSFVAKSKIIQIPSLKASVEEEFTTRPKLIPLNMKAVDMGIQAADQGKQ